MKDETKIEKNETKVETQLGTLYAHTKGEPYPGIQIDLVKDGVSLCLAWVEVDQSEDTPAIKSHVYSVNPEQDEPIFDYTAGEENEDFDFTDPRIH